MQMKPMGPTGPYPQSPPAVYDEPELATEFHVDPGPGQEGPGGESDLIDFLEASAVVGGLFLLIFFAATFAAKMYNG